MKLKITIILIISLIKYSSTYGQVDTFFYSEKKYCFYDLKYRPLGLDEFEFYPTSMIHHESGRYIDHQICFDKNGYISFERTYLNNERSNYKTTYRDSTGFKFYEETALLADSTNIFIKESSWGPNGGLIKVRTFQGNLMNEIKYFDDGLNNNIKSISSWKKVKSNGKQSKFEGSDGRYYAEIIDSNGYTYIPINIFYEFHQNGLIKSSGKFLNKHYNIFKNKKEYELYLKDGSPIHFDMSVDSRIKIGTWKYYDEKGNLTEKIED